MGLERPFAGARPKDEAICVDSRGHKPGGHHAVSRAWFIMHLLRLLYVSKAAPGLTAEDRAAILAKSILNNQRDEITGVLCFRDGHFAQILEGEERMVMRGYLRICTDPRHADHVVVHIAATNRRIFGNWSMGVVGTLEEPVQIFPLDIVKLRSQAGAERDAAVVMQRWLNLLEERAEANLTVAG